MMSCPHCGAENADGSEFCDLCLAAFMPRSAPAPEASRPSAPSPSRAAPDARPPAQAYVSPGDYLAYAREAAMRAPQASYGGAGHYGAGAHAGAARPGTPARGLRTGKLDLIIMLLSYSLLTLLVLLGGRFVISIALLGAAFGGSEAGFSIGVAVLFISDALILAVGGALIAAKARQVGWGWLIGAGCAACTVFLWQPLASLVLMLLLTGEIYVPLFTLVGILFALFLELPMGALGGWVAEKRIYG